MINNYDQYLIDKCLKKKLNPDEYKIYHLKIKEGDEVWEYDDKVPLCGELGIMILKNGKIIKKNTYGNTLKKNV